MKTGEDINREGIASNYLYNSPYTEGAYCTKTRDKSKPIAVTEEFDALYIKVKRTLHEK